MKTLLLTNNIEEVPKMAEWIEAFGEEVGMDLPKVFNVNLALEEAVVNVMNYAYPGKTGMPVRLSADVEGNVIIFTLEDDGEPFDPTKKEDPDIMLEAEERPIGGLGIFLVRQLMDEVTYQRKNDTNILTMKTTLQ